MSTHKQYIQELKPVTFITFDNDSLWDANSRYLIYNNILPDESNNGDPVTGILHYDNDPVKVIRPSYFFGQTSLISNQKTNSYSVIIAPHGYDSLNDFRFVKSFIEIPYVDALLLKYSFTYTMMFNIPRSVGDMRSYIWNGTTYVPANSTNGYNYSNIYRTIIKKGAKFSVTYVSPYGNSEYLEVKFPNNTSNIQISSIEGGILNKPINLVCSHKYIEMDDGRYYTKSRVYINMRLIYSFDSEPMYGAYDGGNTSPVFICGNQDGYVNNTLNDRWTSPIYIDQIAIFDYAIDEYQIPMMYKKIESYEDMIMYAYPTHYYKFDETEQSLYFKNTANNQSYFRLQPPVHKYQIEYGKSGVHGIYGDTCVQIQNSGMIYCDENQYTFFNPSGDYTVEFFAAFTTSERGVLISIQDDVQPFRGLCLYVNSKDNEHVSGMLQLSISDDRYTHTDEFDVRGQRILYNDGKVRHYAIRRSGNFVELWIDGSYVSKVFFSAGNLTSRQNSLFLFNMSPSVLRVEGTIQHLALYTRALTGIELYAHATYLIRYKLKGRVTVNSIGTKVMVRIYEFNNGKLLMQVDTDGDGHYDIDVHYADYINFIAMVKNDTTVRPRTVGPILAAEYIDNHYQ